ncbi:sensor histidine kinase [Streptomyces sp. NPDC002309]
MEAADIALAARPLRSRLAAASPWSGGRIAGESVLTVVLAGLAGLFGAAETGLGLRAFAVAAVVAALSLVRRSLPATVLVVSAAMAGELVAATPLLVYASWSAGSRIMKPGRALAAYAVAFVLHVALTARNEIDADSALSLSTTGALSAVMFLTLAIVPGLAARYRAQRHALLDALRRHNAQLVREQRMVARQARLLERHRIAQDMHDSLGHQLALISVHAGALEVATDLNDRQREGVRILREASVAAMRELREAVGILHEDRDEREPGEEEDGAYGAQGAGGPPDAAADPDVGRPAGRVVGAVDGLVESSRAAGAAVELRRSGDVRPLAPAADHAAYRIAQEGLTNAHKHAPGAPITVALRYEPDSLLVEVANGPVPGGTSAAPHAVSGGQGLAGLRERARLVGGMVHTGPTADGGFRVAGVLPYGSPETDPAAARREATSVDTEDDFRGQRGPGAAGDGGAVIDRSDPQGEFAAIMSRKKNVAIGCAVTAFVVVAGIVALGVWGVVALMDDVESATIPRSVYESVRLGDSEAAVRDKLPEGDSVLTAGMESEGPPPPVGATCRHFWSEDVEKVYRFCFRDGALVDKARFASE